MAVSETYDNFQAMGLKAELTGALSAQNITKPSQLQQQAIIPCVSGRDVIVRACAGSGKTTAAIISALERIDTNLQETQVLVLQPTREVARHVATMFEALGAGLNVHCHACIGGTALRQEIQDLTTQHPHVFIGTPGRSFDMITRGILDTSHVKILMLDETDEIMGRGFEAQLIDICQSLPANIQIVLLTSTLPQEISAFSEKFMRDPLCLKF